MPECSSKKVNNMFLIGAGFTKAVFPKAPLNNDLLEKLIKYCKNKDIPTPLKKYKREYKTDDIEIILTKLDLEIAGSRQNNTKSIEDDRKTIGKQIAGYFMTFVFNEERFNKNKWPCNLAKLFSDKDAIVSLNYDCFLEGLLGCSGLWDPTGYAHVKHPLFKPENPNPRNILVYKIHGSSNFRIFQKVIIPIIDDAIFPCSEECVIPFNSNETPLYIIAPSFVKIPHPQIERMMIEVLDVADKAKNFIIIGCGMRPEDAFLWLLLTNFLCRPDKNGRIIIVDPYADSIKEKINRHYWGGNEVTNVVDIKGELQKEDILDELLKVVSK